jgi:hypothetical protein
MRHSATIEQRCGGWHVHAIFALLATIGAALSVAVLPTAALAASSPAIEWTNAWNLTPTDATVGAGINPEGLSHFGAYYEFQVVANTSEYLSEIACPPRAKLRGTDGCGPGPEVEGALPIGQVPNATKGETVTLDLAGAGMTLKPGTTYHYRVLAAKALETEDTLQWEPPAVLAPDQTFTTPLASAPSIESESTSSVTPTAATLEAKINSEDLPQGAYYQFQVVKSTSEYLPELACPEPSVQLDGDDGCGIAGPGGGHPTAGALPIGFIAKGPEGQSVSESLAAAGVTLQPGTTYHYRVLAVKRVQSEDTVDWGGPFVAGPDQTFTTPPPPAIESTSVSNVTEHDATLEAQIDTEGLETSYQFRLSAICGGKGACLVVVNYPLPSGLLLGSFVDQSVSLDLNAAGVTLQPGGTYTYSLSATNASGTTESAPHNFTTPENVVQPLTTTTTTTLPLSGSGQPAGSNSGDQPAGPGGSPAPVVRPLGPRIVCLCDCARGCHSKQVGPRRLTRTQKLTRALNACHRKFGAHPPARRRSCENAALERYGSLKPHGKTKK